MAGGRLRPGIPVGKVQMEGKSLDEQFLLMSQAGILTAPSLPQAKGMQRVLHRD